MKKWTMREVAINKTRPILILTVLLTFILTKLINHLFTRRVTLENGIIHTDHFFLNGWMILILAIPTGLISAFIIQFLLNLGDKQTIPVAQRREFTWYSVYSIFLGFMIYHGLLIGVYSTFDSNSLLIIFAPVLSIIVAVIFAMIINKVMIRLTQTNARIILEIEQKQHEHHFQEPKLKAQVIKALQRGHISTISGALWYVKVTGILRWVFMFFVRMFKGLFILLGRLVQSFTRAMGHRGGSYTPLNPSTSSQGDSNWEKQQAKNLAEYQARQAQKQANYTARKFTEQFNYNARHSGSAWNRYKNDQQKANEARRKANRM